MNQKKMTGVKAKKDNFQDYYKLKCDENNIYWSGHKNKPDKEKLEKWYLENISLNTRLFFLFYEVISNDIIGYLYMDFVGNNNDTIETGHGVHSDKLGNRYGSSILKFGIDYAIREIPGIFYFQGWIMEDNIASIKNFLRLGYNKTSETKIIEMSSGKLEKMNKYVLEIR